MMKSHSRLRAFTLIELMMVVAIIGILAAIAVPAFLKYIKKSKTAEARTNLRKIYDGEVTYFSEEHTTSAAGATASKVFVAVTLTPGTVPSNAKAAGNWEQAGWQALKFSSDSPVAYAYETSAGGVNTAASFTARARGDLDGDGTTSLFERIGTVTAAGEIQGGAGLYHNSDLE